MVNETNGNESIESILIVDDDDVFCNLLKSLIIKIFPDVSIIEHNPLEKGIPDENFNWSEYDLLILDYDLGDNQNGLDLLSKFRDLEHFPSTIFLTAQGNEEIAVQAIRYGAQDYINKQKLSIDRLKEAIRNTREKQVNQSNLKNTLSLQSALFNKVVFYKKLQELIDTSTEDEHSYLFQVGIDNFDEIYRKFGILTVDNYIIHFSEWLAKFFHKNENISITRIGDSVVAIIITGCKKLDDVKEIASKLCKSKIDEYTSESGQNITATFSVGISPVMANTSVKQIMTWADVACRKASKDKSNSFVINTDDTGQLIEDNDGNLQNKAVAEINLEEIVNENRIQPFYCPCIAISEAATEFEFNYFKVTSKIIDEENNIIDSNELPNISLTKGHLGLLDRWIIRHAIGQAYPVKKENKNLNLGLLVNLSTPSLGAKVIHNWMEKLIKTVNLEGLPSCLIFEISPLDFISNKKQTLDFINKMRDKWSVGFALNNIVKSDIVEICVKTGGFEYVSMDMNEERKELITEVTNICKELGVLTLLYDINDGESLNYAIEIGIDFGQGEFIQPPLEQIVINNEVISI